MIRPLGMLYARWRVRRSLDGVWVSGLEHLVAAATAGPVLLASNHVAWWDGVVARLVDEAAGLDARTLVAAPTVARLPWLRAFGAIPLAPTSPRAGLREAAHHLSGAGRAVWIYPQGRQRPAALRPLGFQRGLGLLARLAPAAAVVPVAVEYPFRRVHLPAAALAFGPPVSAAPAALPDAAEAAVAALLDRVLAWADGAGGDFVPLVPSRVRAIDERAGARALVEVR